MPNISPIKEHTRYKNVKKSIVICHLYCIFDSLKKSGTVVQWIE